MMKVIIGCICLLAAQWAYAQNTDSLASASPLPYHTIPDYPRDYNACNVAARMIDGLGFRYYWATEGLREADLAFKPGEEARTTEETLDHIYGLTKMVVNAIRKVPVASSQEVMQFTFEEKRGQTLQLLKEASDRLKESEPEALEDFKLIFERQEGNVEIPFWNLINGPIADALWHVGQVVSFRRSSGNPINSKVNVLMGNPPE